MERRSVRPDTSRRYQAGSRRLSKGIHRSNKGVTVKRRIAALALALLAFPATALAMPQDPVRSDQGAPSSSLGVPPDLAPNVQSHLPTKGTDVAAPDQQASKSVAPATESASSSGTSDFDWADAAVGAAVTAGLLGASFAGAVALRRRQRGQSALAG
jgi:hypothetical protein